MLRVLLTQTRHVAPTPPNNTVAYFGSLAWKHRFISKRKITYACHFVGSFLHTARNYPEGRHVTVADVLLRETRPPGRSILESASIALATDLCEDCGIEFPLRHTV